MIYPASKRYIQAIFEKIADEYEGAASIVEWREDYAVIHLKNESDEFIFFLRDRANQSGLNLVSISQEGSPDILIEPIPSAIIAVVTR